MLSSGVLIVDMVDILDILLNGLKKKKDAPSPIANVNANTEQHY
jgi:hypothetical protein